jgi:predicted porin
MRKGGRRHACRLLSTVASIGLIVPGMAAAAYAQTAPNAAQLQALEAQVKELQRTTSQLQQVIEGLLASQKEEAAQVKAAQDQASQAQAQASQAQAQASQAQAQAAQTPGQAGELDSQGHAFLEHKKGDALTFFTPGGEITGYGNFDVSIDAATKSLGNPTDQTGAHPVGNFGWMADISSNNSFLGVRGFQRLPGMPLQFVYQFEAGIEIAATPGLKESNSNESNTVNGTLFNRNTYVGFYSPDWGAIKIGKTDAPYKNATQALNPFAGELGDYAVVMGNTGGDNRVEFGTRLDHSIWYESPTFGHVSFDVLFSPGQNRASDSDNLAAGESDCAGGNIPESGGDVPIACNDGAFSDVVSGAIKYSNGPLYLTVAGELHHNVNRQSDITAIYGAGSVAALSGTQLAQFDQDVANEEAYKAAALYTFPTKTLVGGIVEYLHRDVPEDLQFQNERQRWGTWLVLGQSLTSADSVFLGWAHAFHTPGDPGQHNDATLTTPDGVGTFASHNNQADLFTFAWKHFFTGNLSIYADVAATVNGPSAHYDLGAGGRSVTTDCHDAFGATGGAASTPHCWTGQTLMGVSSGVKWTF